ncbi:CCA tRNA nucleotidyltransferase [Candidatus Micrarchaeota archaeon]|nr:CCA tRNA nucleotidyltransferase [Candidatus Micrarchaeota archaeon]
MAKNSNDAALENVFSAVAKKVSPTPIEAKTEKAFAQSIRSKLQAAFGNSAQLFFVGSTARDTGIRGDRDIDIFVAFPKGKSRDEIVAKTISTVKKTLKANWEMHYAEHPYLQGRIDGYKLEIVPCFRIQMNEGIISAVDRTPLHALYLQKKLTERQKRDVRVLKALLKAHGIYGAELEIEGFSGLVCEYLVLNYRSLANLLKEASSWKPPMVLDIENYHEGKYDLLIKKYQTPLIIIDFIDKNRNAAAAISLHSFSKFIQISRQVLQKPSSSWFERKIPKINLPKLHSELESRNFLLLKMAKPKGIISDVLVPQLRRSAMSIEKQLKLFDFDVFNSFSFSDEKYSCILLELPFLENYPLEKIQGPPIFMEKDLQKFLSKHKNSKRLLIENGKAVSEQPRREKSAVSIIQKIRKSPQKSGIGSNYLLPFKNSSIFSGQALLAALKKNPSFKAKFAEFLSSEL